MKNLNYEQPKFEVVALEVTDILLASGGDETIGALDAEYAVALDPITWGEIWSE